MTGNELALALRRTKGKVSVGVLTPGDVFWVYAEKADLIAWALLKRGLHGVYHHASDKHIGRYVNEFAFRLNDGNVNRRTLARESSI